MMNKHKPVVEEFSDSYYHLPEVEVTPYSGENVVVAGDMMRGLGRFVSAPLIKLSTGHYWLHTEWGIPANTIAVPFSKEDGGERALLAKDQTTKSLLHKEVIEPP